MLDASRPPAEPEEAVVQALREFLCSVDVSQMSCLAKNRLSEFGSERVDPRGDPGIDATGICVADCVASLQASRILLGSKIHEEGQGKGRKHLKEDATSEGLTLWIRVPGCMLKIFQGRRPTSKLEKVDLS